MSHLMTGMLLQQVGQRGWEDILAAGGGLFVFSFFFGARQGRWRLRVVGVSNYWVLSY